MEPEEWSTEDLLALGNELREKKLGFLLQAQSKPKPTIVYTAVPSSLDLVFIANGFIMPAHAAFLVAFLRAHNDACGLQYTYSAKKKESGRMIAYCRSTGMPQK